MTAAAKPEQLVLGLEHRPALGRADFLVSPSNNVAVAMMEDWRAWPGGRMALVGAARAGKSHLAAVWLAESGARAVELALLGPENAVEFARGPVLIEGIDRLPEAPEEAKPDIERGLLHLLNLAAAERHPVLLTGRSAPAHWQVTLPDLASRLSAFPVATIGPPDDALLTSVMVKFFSDRQLRVAPKVLTYILRRMERSFAAAERLVDALDREALSAKKPVSIALATRVLDRLDATF